MASYLRPKRGKKSTAIAQKLILKRGEVFFEVPNAGVGKGTGKIKIGDGTTVYEDLPYFLEEKVVAEQTIQFTITTETDNNKLLNKVASGAKLNVIIASVRNLITNILNTLNNKADLGSSDNYLNGVKIGSSTSSFPYIYGDENNNDIFFRVGTESNPKYTSVLTIINSLSSLDTKITNLSSSTTQSISSLDTKITNLSTSTTQSISNLDTKKADKTGSDTIRSIKSSTSYKDANFIAEMASGGNKAGYGFHNAGTNGCLLYLNKSDSALHILLSNGADYKLVDSRCFSYSNGNLNINV